MLCVFRGLFALFKKRALLTTNTVFSVHFFYRTRRVADPCWHQRRGTRGTPELGGRGRGGGGGAEAPRRPPPPRGRGRGRGRGRVFPLPVLPLRRVRQAVPGGPLVGPPGPRPGQAGPHLRPSVAGGDRALVVPAAGELLHLKVRVGGKNRVAKSAKESVKLRTSVLLSQPFQRATLGSLRG